MLPRIGPRPSQTSAMLRRDVSKGNATWIRIGRAAAGTVLSVALLLFIGRGVWRNAAAIRDLDWQLRLLPLAAAFLLLLAAYVVYFVQWRAILRDLGQRVDLATGFRIWTLSQIGKYVPGKIWAAVGRVVLLRRAGIDPFRGALSVVLELALLVASGLVFSALTLPWWEGRVLRAAAAEIAPAGTILTLGLAALVLALLPGSWSVLIGLTRRLAGVGPDADVPRIPLRRVGRLCAGYGLSWLLTGAGFGLLVLSLHAIPLRAFPGVAGAFVFSWVIGSLVVIAPAGLGIRETMLLVFLNGLVPTEVALVTVIASRIWTTATEATMVAAALAVRPTVPVGPGVR